MKVMTLHQPYATLIALGIKTIETRSQKTNVRGRIAIHAAAQRPKGGWLDDGEYPPLFGHMENYWDAAEDPNGSYSYHWRWCGPLGVIVATANLYDCIPMVAGPGCGPRALRIFDSGPPWLLGDDPAGDPIIHRDFTAQLPYGDFRPGRWAWMLDDVEPLATPVPFKGGQGWSRSWNGNV